MNELLEFTDGETRCKLTALTSHTKSRQCDFVSMNNSYVGNCYGQILSRIYTDLTAHLSRANQSKIGSYRVLDMEWSRIIKQDAR